MKKIVAFSFLVACFGSIHAYPFNLRQILSTATFKNALAHINTQKILTSAKYIGAATAVVGIGCIVARLINNQRNTSSSFTITERPSNQDEKEKITQICTDGLITISSSNQLKLSVTTEILDADEHFSSKSHQKLPSALTLPWWKKAWYWIREPSHRCVTHHIVQVPKDAQIEVKSTNKNPYAHRYKNVITIEGPLRSISATAASGDIFARDFEGSLQVNTPNSIVIENFKGNIQSDEFSHFYATKRKDCTNPWVVLKHHNQQDKDLYNVASSDLEDE